MFITAQIAVRLWLTLVSIGAAASLSLAIREPQPAEPLRVGFCDWPGSECLLLAERLGYFADEGIDVRLFNFKSLTETRRAFERGQLHGACGTLVELLQTYDHTDLGPKAVYATSFSHGADVILADAAYASMEDLRRQRIGVEVASLSTYVLSRALELSGMTLNDVQLVLLDSGEMEAAIAAGEVDAVVTYPPYSNSILTHHPMHPVFDSRQIPREVIDLIYFDQQALRARPDDVRRLLSAYDRAVQFTLDHPEIALPMMADRLGMDAAALQYVFDHEISLCRADEQNELLDESGPMMEAAAQIQQQLIDIGQIRPRPHFTLPAQRRTDDAAPHASTLLQRRN